jgi:hypothetical protein
MNATFVAAALRLVSTAAILFTALAPVRAVATPQNLYVSNSFFNTGVGSIEEIPPDFSFLPSFAFPVSNPRGLAFDSVGKLFVATTSVNNSGVGTGTLLNFNSNGSRTTVGSVLGDKFLEGVAASNGNVFVMAQDNTSPNLASTIYRFDSSGGPPTPFGSFPGQGFGLEFNSAGNLFAAHFSQRQIFEFEPDGTRTLFATVGTIFPNGAITGPNDFAFDNSGNLFVTVEPSFAAPLTTPGEIIKITPEGVQSVFATGLTGNIFGLAFDMSGNLFVTDRAGQIFEFTPEGVETVLPFGLLDVTFLTFGPPSGRSVPDTGTTPMLLGIALSGLGLLRRFVRQ